MKKETRLTIFNKYGGKCAYCGCDLHIKEMQGDHIKPKALGGQDVIENYNPSCRHCNFYKSTFDVEGFRNRISTLAIRIQKPFIVRLAMKYGIIEFKPWSLFYFERTQTHK